MLSVAFAYFIHFTGLDLAWCFLIVFGVYVLLAAPARFVGYKQIKKVGPRSARSSRPRRPRGLQARRLNGRTGPTWRPLPSGGCASAVRRRLPRLTGKLHPYAQFPLDTRPSDSSPIAAERLTWSAVRA